MRLRDLSGGSRKTVSAFSSESQLEVRSALWSWKSDRSVYEASQAMHDYMRQWH